MIRNTPIHRLLNELYRINGQHPAPTESGWRARCPAHDDRKPSLSVSEGYDGRVLVKCHAGCSTDEICRALDINSAALFPAPIASTSTNPPETRKIRESIEVETVDGRQSQSNWSRGRFPSARHAVATLERQLGKPSATWTYHDADCELVGLVLRWDQPNGGKEIRPVSRNGEGWKIGGMSEPRPLYRLPELSGAKRVYVTEGEKAADAARSIGRTATTSPHGSKAAHKADWSPLAGKEIILLPDNDPPGRMYAEAVAGILAMLKPPATVKLVELPDLPEGGDIHDWLEQRDAHDPGELQQTVERLADQAGPFVPAPAAPPVERYLPFPVDVLPEPARTFVADGAKAIGCDPSYLALPMLAVLGAAIGTSRRIQLKRGWSAPPIIWAVIVGESGTAKTPAFKLVMGPVRKRQGRALQRHEEAMKAYEAELQRYEKDYGAWKRDKKAHGDPPEPPEQPQAERFVVSDTTVEALAPILKHNPRGLLLARDELAGWIGSFDRYAAGQRGDSAHWLSMHNGESIIVDRKTGYHRTIYVPTAAVSVTGGIQPAILNKALGSEHRESGLAARLLLACPPRKPKRWTEADIEPRLVGEVADILDRLYELEPSVDENGEPAPVIVSLAPEAKKVWVDFYNAHSQEQAELTGELAAAWSKLEEYAARLALVVHFARWATGDPTLASVDAVDERSISAGIELARWFGHEARRVYGLLSESDEERDRRELVELIQRKAGQMTPRELVQASRKYRSVDEAEAALNELAESDRGVWETVGTEGRPKRVFVLSTLSTSTKAP